MSLGSQKPVRATSEVIEVICQFSIGASGAHTKVYGNGMSVVRNSAGKFTVTFAEVTPVLLDLQVTNWVAADAEALVSRPTDGSYSFANKTVAYETYVIDETAAQTDPASGDTVTITAKFLKTV